MKQTVIDRVHAWLEAEFGLTERQERIRRIEQFAAVSGFREPGRTARAKLAKPERRLRWKTEWLARHAGDFAVWYRQAESAVSDPLRSIRQLA